MISYFWIMIEGRKKPGLVIVFFPREQLEIRFFSLCNFLFCNVWNVRDITSSFFHTRCEIRDKVKALFNFFYEYLRRLGA